MSRAQLALSVSDIGATVDFYSKPFATEPTKVRPGYANFAVADPPLNLVLIEDANQTPGTINHLRVEVASSDEVIATQSRLAATGLTTAFEEQSSCCDALQDKVWVTGPGDEPWEIYTVLEDVEMPAGQLRSDVPGGSACCATGPELTGTTTGPDSCC